MKCALCPQTIDEAQQFPPVEGPGGRLIDDEVSRVRLASALEKWTHVQVTAQARGGCLSVFSDHVCPKHDVSKIRICLPAQEKEGK